MRERGNEKLRGDNRRTVTGNSRTRNPMNVLQKLICFGKSLSHRCSASRKLPKKHILLPTTQRRSHLFLKSWIFPANWVRRQNGFGMKTKKAMQRNTASYGKLSFLLWNSLHRCSAILQWNRKSLHGFF